MLKALEHFFAALGKKHGPFSGVWDALADWCEDRRWWLEMRLRRIDLIGAVGSVQEARSALAHAGAAGAGAAHDVSIDPQKMCDDAQAELEKCELVLRDLADYHDLVPR